MKTYNCACGELLFFENITCVNCRREVGFLPDLALLSSLEKPDDKGLYPVSASEGKGRLYKKCQNYAQHNVCNWMVPADNNEAFCTSCRLDVVIPDLSMPKNLGHWAAIETAKRRLVYTALRLGLPLANRVDEPQTGLGFRFMGDVVNPDGIVASKVITEHNEGLITLNLNEADDSAREKMRASMREPYRTLLGHFRHESGHYYWDRLVRDTKFLEPCRAIFGDDRQDYGESMKTYYANGAPADWNDHFISEYSSMHPWEDWAETWAHYLHIQDTLEVAADFGLVNKRVKLAAAPDGEVKAEAFDRAMEKWAELTIALNSINRSMGLRDLYPFVLSKPVVDKLRFVAQVIAGDSSAT
jgi:hypothetical protein